MATKPTKKKNSTSFSKKRPIRKKKKNKSNIKRTMLISLLSLTLFLFLGVMYYFISYKNQSTSVNKKVKSHNTKKLLDDVSKIKTKETHTLESIRKPKATPKKLVVKKEKKSEPPFVERGKEKIAKKKQENVVVSHNKKPKLAIIIDDVHTKKQINVIKSLGLKITPSIFPPYAMSKHSNLLAKQVKHSMIHLPMESGSKQLNTQTKTLMTSFSDEKIADRVMELRRLFPNTKYVNNHTGSVFTDNYKAMKKLYIALKMEGFVFVDSYTKASSQIGKIADELGERYIKRDIFIDNTQTIGYIHNQLKKAVEKAKKRGYAIAIGHPHKVTMKALASAKEILKEVELVYIDKI